MRKIVIAAVSLFLSACALPWTQEKPDHWTPYYGAVDLPELHDEFDVLVFDLDAHPPLDAFKQQGTKIFAYISASEIAPHRTYMERFNSEIGFFVKPNPAWGSEVIDIRNKAWQAFVVDELVQNAVKQGFDGVFIDTIDSSLMLEKEHPEKFAGTTSAANYLIHNIRKKLPVDKCIILNRGFDILPLTLDQIDIVVAESIATDSQYDYLAKTLISYREKKPALKIYALDYPDLQDRRSVERVWCMHQKNGFSPALAERRLQTVVMTRELLDSFSCPLGQ